MSLKITCMKSIIYSGEPHIAIIIKQVNIDFIRGYLPDCFS